MTIYELTDEYRMLLEMAGDEDVDPDVLADTMEAIEGELEVKAEGYGKVIRQLEADSAALKTEADRLSARKKSIDSSIDRMKAVLQRSMTACNKPKIETQLFKFTIRKNPPSVVMDLDDITKIPDKYLAWQDPKIDKSKIKEDLKAGKDLNGIAHLEQGESLQIK